MGYLNPEQGEIREGNIPPMDPAAPVADLVAATGTADGTVADVGTIFSQETLNNNFKDVSSKINELMASLRAAGYLDE